MAKGLLKPRWMDSCGEPIHTGNFVHTVHEEFVGKWFYKMPAVVYRRNIDCKVDKIDKILKVDRIEKVDETDKIADGDKIDKVEIVRVEFVGFGHPCHRVKFFKPEYLTIIGDDEYLAYLKRLQAKLDYGDDGCVAKR